MFGLVELLGIALLIVYIVWLFAFFQFVRPRIMNGIGARMNVGVQESLDPLDAGTYNTVGKVSLGKSAAVQLLDVALLLFGTVGACAILSIPSFLIAESGAPYRWEGALLGTQASIVAVQIEPMQNDMTNVAVTIENEGNTPAAQCQLRTADYSAGNGYMNGSSALFDVSGHASQEVKFTLSALNAKPGEYTVNLSLECQNRLKDRVAAHVQVVE